MEGPTDYMTLCQVQMAIKTMSFPRGIMCQTSSRGILTQSGRMYLSTIRAMARSEPLHYVISPFHDHIMAAIECRRHCMTQDL